MEAIWIKEDIDQFVPNYLKASVQDNKRIFMMCKYYAHDIPCQFMERFGQCKQIHEVLVKNAHSYIKECR